MKKYIELEKAFDAVFGQFCASSDETEAALNAAIEEIRAIPAADVRPVVRGKWQVYYTDLDRLYTRCTACLCSFRGAKNHYNFCPSCGADMRPEPPKEET